MPHFVGETTSPVGLRMATEVLGALGRGPSELLTSPLVLSIVRAIQHASYRRE